MRIIASAVVTSALLVVGCGGGELPTETDATPETQTQAPQTQTQAPREEGTVHAMGGPYYYATSADAGRRLTVCANTLTVFRSGPGSGTTCTLYGTPPAQSFTVSSVSGDWVFGFAYGYCNFNGWVQNGWFC
jgi:hypothetical protein